MAFTIEEPIIVVPPDPTWPMQYAVEKRFLQDLFGLRLRGIEHIGSTSVPGLDAKPIVDIMIGVPELEITAHELEQLLLHGYEYFGQAGVPNRLYARKRGLQKFNLQIVCYRGLIWFNNLAIRDYLCSHPTEAAIYAGFKYTIINDGISSLLSYTERKCPFMFQLRQRAKGWYEEHLSSIRHLSIFVIFLF